MKLIIAGGGTGGHLFPGVAIAEEFLKRSGKNRILFVGTEKGLEKRVLPELGFELRTIEVVGIKGKGLRALMGLLKLPASLVQSRTILNEFTPDMVIGVGGYASGPVVLASYLRGLPTAIAEQNAIPGWTNRLLAKIADRIFLSFPDNSGWAPRDKTVLTGNPIRSVLMKDGEIAKKPGLFTVLIFGGSQGAHRINEAVIDSIGYLNGIKDKLNIIHQTGNDDVEKVRQTYSELGIQADVRPFINEMEDAYSVADLLICRAGATSIAEITACGKAAILIPYPHAIGDHQTRNAEVLTNEGAAKMMPQSELNGEALADLILEFYSNPAKLREMEKASLGLGHSRAAQHIIDECLRLVVSKK